jgi:hypothetical protein
VSDNLVDNFVIFDKGDHFHLSAALRADQWIHFKRSERLYLKNVRSILGMVNTTWRWGVSSISSSRIHSAHSQAFPGEILIHEHRTFHFQGAEADLDKLARKCLGVILDNIKSALK